MTGPIDFKRKPAAPYPGLRAFEPHESGIFCGREEQIDRMLCKLEDHRFLAVIGASGCGKSSLVRAGLIPALNNGFYATGVRDWRFIIIRPEDAPISNLARAFNNSIQTESKADSDSMITEGALIESTLRRSPLGLQFALEQYGTFGPDTHVLLLVDQFEELFRFRYSDRRKTRNTLYEERNEASIFVDLLLTTAGTQTRVPVHIVVTMRSDFMGDCDAFRGLPEAMNEGQFLTPRLTRVQTHEAIVRPLSVFQADASPDLVNALLNDVGNDPDQLPLMQHALMRTWLRGNKDATEKRAKVFLTKQNYSATGGLQAAISQHGNEILKEPLIKQKSDIIRNLFLNLVDRGLHGQVVRRPSTIGEICEITGEDVREIEPIVRAFASSDRCFIRISETEAISKTTRIDLTHEAILRKWDTLRDEWLTDEIRSVETYQGLADSAAAWKKGEELLLKPPRLDIALQWRDEGRNPAWATRHEPDQDYDQTLQYIQTSERVREKEVRRKRHKRYWIGGSLVLAAMLGIILALIFSTLWQNAEIAKEDAKSNASKFENALEKLKLKEEAEKNAKEEATRQKLRAQREEGKAWIERARYYGDPDQKNSFYTAMMAARALGFQGYGRNIQKEDFKNTYPILTTPGSREEREAKTLIRNSIHAVPLWCSPVISQHSDNINSVAFSPDGNTLASGSRDNTIKLWDPIHNILLAPYIASDWLRMDGRNVIWSPTTDNLYKSRTFRMLNVPRFSIPGVLRSKLSITEKNRLLFWKYLHAGNLNSAEILLGKLEKDGQTSAAEVLTEHYLKSAGQAYSDKIPDLAEFRLNKAENLLERFGQSDRAVDLREEFEALRSRISAQ